MSDAYVQANANSISSARTLTSGFASNNTAGNAIIVGLSLGVSSTAGTAVTDTLGNTYSQVGAWVANGTAAQVAMFYAKNIAAGANTVKWQVTDTFGFMAITIAEWSGLSTSTPLDQTGSGATGSSTTPTTGSFSPNAGDLLFVAQSNAGDSVAQTPGSGFLDGSDGSHHQLTTTNSNMEISCEYRLSASSGSQTAGETLASSQPWAILWATFAAAGGNSDPFPAGYSQPPLIFWLPA